MRTGITGEVRERLRQLLLQRARALGLTPAAIEVLRHAALFDRWAMGDTIVSGAGGDARIGLVVVGAVKVVCETPRGKRVGVGFVPPGRFLGGGWPCQSWSAHDEMAAIAHDPLGTVVATWAPGTMVEVLSTLPGPGALVVATAGWRDAVDVVRQKCHLLGLGLRDRVLAVLTVLAHDFGIPHPDGVRVELRLTHQDLAGAAVGSRANVTRALEELRADGLVAVEQHRLIVTHRGLVAFDDEARTPSWTGPQSCAAQ